MPDVGLCWNNRRVMARRLSGGCKCIFFRQLRGGLTMRANQALG